MQRVGRRPVGSIGVVVAVIGWFLFILLRLDAPTGHARAHEEVEEEHYQEHDGQTDAQGDQPGKAPLGAL